MDKPTDAGVSKCGLSGDNRVVGASHQFAGVPNGRCLDTPEAQARFCVLGQEFPRSRFGRVGCSTAALEELFEHVGGFICQHTRDEMDPVVEAWIGCQLEEARAGTGFWVECAKDHPADAGVDDQPGAHGARLERDGERAVVEPPVADGLAGLFDGNELGVSGW